MRSGMAAVRAEAKRRQIEMKKERIIRAFALNPHYRPKATVKVARAVILGGPYMFQDGLRDIRAKSLGAGVYELSVELKE